MKKIICFDVDGTLIGEKDQPNWGIINMLKTLFDCGHTIIVWSGGGKDYAEIWVKRLFLDNYVSECRMKPRIAEDLLDEIDVSFDDEDVTLAKCNIKI